jgi:thioredoxin reductase (NADPH)
MPLETIIVSDENLYDVLIVGSGPSGLTVGTNLAKKGLKVGIIEKATPGGKLVTIPQIHNYPPAPNIPGSVLANQFYELAIQAGVKFIYQCISNVVKKLGYVAIYGADGIT